MIKYRLIDVKDESVISEFESEMCISKEMLSGTNGVVVKGQKYHYPVIVFNGDLQTFDIELISSKDLS